jgi:hypothetical protein
MGAANAVPTYVDLGAGFCMDAPAANHRLSGREVLDNARCAQKMAADKEEQQAEDVEM